VDVGSAIALARRGFQALATTSAGFAFTRGLLDAADALARDDVSRTCTRSCRRRRSP